MYFEYFLNLYSLYGGDTIFFHTQIMSIYETNCENALFLCKVVLLSVTNLFAQDAVRSLYQPGLSKIPIPLNI